MPLYEFHCGKCGADSEVLIRSTDWKGTSCPHCGSMKLEKKLSVFAAANADGMAEMPAPTCSGNPNSCGRCGTL